jgi:parvulin-like peptidyl-prolyl isomerase
MARRDPTADNFGQLAEQYSTEPGSRSLRGKVPPIQMHGGQPALEQQAFALKEGEISGVIQVGEKFVILFCEGLTKPEGVEMSEVASILRSDLHEKKIRLAMAKEFDRLQDAADVENILDPKASHKPAPKAEKLEKSPGIATRPGPATQDAPVRR